MENINDKMLNNAALLFILTIVGIIVGQWWMSPSYKLTNEKVLETVQSTSKLLLPVELQHIMKSEAKQTSAIFLMEEKPLSFTHFDQQLFIPFNEILSGKQLKKINKGNEILLFGETESQAMMALQLLVSQGFKQVKAVSNNFDFNQKMLSSGLEAKTAFMKGEKADFDYTRFFKTSGGTGKPEAPASKIPEATEVVKTAGGCS